MLNAREQVIRAAYNISPQVGKKVEEIVRDGGKDTQLLELRELLKARLGEREGSAVFNMMAWVLKPRGATAGPRALNND